jgi:hypothetical protein
VLRSTQVVVACVPFWHATGIARAVLIYLRGTSLQNLDGTKYENDLLIDNCR